MRNYVVFLLALICLNSCKKDGPKIEESSGSLFSLVDSKDSNVNFKNILNESYEFNFLNYPYIYIGGGVAVGDINNDGLDDIYFISNQGSNKLYLNKGNFEFQDITISAEVTDNSGWSTGVSMIDINNDGFLDIYVCKAGSLNNNQLRKNKLFINQGDNTFEENAENYGLDHPGFSTQSYFFDYDKDGDLDMYLVNHRPDFKNNRKISSDIQNEIFEISSDQLFRNDGATFSKVSSDAGIVNKAWGLSASIGDFNNDGWLDIYVANDYLEPDMLYINQKDGTFKNEVLESMNHISFNSMGSDYADINNDALPDLLVLDMLAEDHERGKENMASMSTENFNTMVEVGYHYQYMSNVLQLNNGNGNYSDIGQLSGITKTDWSWAPLIADFDNDGLKDVFITNGIEKDLGNQDFRRQMQDLNANNIALTLDSLLNLVPSAKLSNYIFKNNGDLSFSNQTQDWGIDYKVNSNGAAYSDLDNDGDLDLIINNENDIAHIYRNNATNKSIRIKLNGDSKNNFATGAKIKVKTTEGVLYQELFTNRGFLSSVSNVLNFGLGDAEFESLEIVWPDGKRTYAKSVDLTNLNEFSYTDAVLETKNDSSSNKSIFNWIDQSNLGINYQHKENLFNDYEKQLLLPQKQSSIGPCIAVADVNNDGLDDMFFGGAHKQSGVLYVQESTGKFRLSNINLLNSDADHEDVGAHFFDADSDGDLDLYVASGGYEFNASSDVLQDRLYINDGKGNFSKSNKLPKIESSTKAVKSYDYDLDGDLDLIIGGRVIPGKYPLAPKSYILENRGNKFVDVSNVIAKEFEYLGMISDIEIVDLNSDGVRDFVVVGPWMPVTAFSFQNNEFLKLEVPSFKNSEGWNYTLASADFDNDGDMDLVVGNIGANNKFSPSIKKPLYIFSSDFDKNGSYDIALSKKYKDRLVPIRGKECSSEQTPYLNDKIESYKEFALLNIQDIYGEDIIDNSNRLSVFNFNSMYYENLGNFEFKARVLPNTAQLGPTLDFEILDVNKDGNLDIIGVGNYYDAEVETIKYDASRGYILLGNGKSGFSALTNSGFFNNSDMRAIEMVKSTNQSYFVVINNNMRSNIFKFQ